jgi:hypothetical protein
MYKSKSGFMQRTGFGSDGSYEKKFNICTHCHNIPLGRSFKTCVACGKPIQQVDAENFFGSDIYIVNILLNRLMFLLEDKELYPEDILFKVIKGNIELIHKPSKAIVRKEIIVKSIFLNNREFISFKEYCEDISEEILFSFRDQLSVNLNKRKY